MTRQPSLNAFFFFSSEPLKFQRRPPAASSPAILSLFIFIYFIFFAHMGPDEMFEGSQHPFAYQQGRSSPVRRNKPPSVFRSRIESRPKTVTAENLFTVPARLRPEAVALTVCPGGEMPSCPSASPHLLTHSVTHDRTGLPPSRRPTQLAFLFPLSLILCRNFTVREQSYFKKERLFTLPSYLNNKSTFRQRAASFVCDCRCCLATFASDAF